MPIAMHARAHRKLRDCVTVQLHAMSKKKCICTSVMIKNE